MMKKIIKIFSLSVLLLGLLGCNKSNNPGDITGEWKLENYYGNSASSASVKAEVYLNFCADGTFEIFQKLGTEGHFSAFTGLYETAGGLLYGDYDGVESSYWASNYKYYVSGDVLTLEDSDNPGSGTCLYVRSSIPESVRRDAADFAE